ncbi:MAG: hypothetical protein Q4Q19_03355 [Methanobrevibacter sp.]|nr:hypothetical protein [Methanobrevibacter sp.]
MSADNTIQTNLDGEKVYPHKCKWCGKPFTKQHNRQEYCSEECAHHARLEQKAKYTQKYRLKYTSRKSDSYWGMGSGSLGCHMKDDFEDEQRAIHKELKRLKLK